MRRRAVLSLLVAVAVAIPGLGLTAIAQAAPIRASLTQLENELMCVACHESLAVAQSPESFSERQYVRDLIAKGETDAQIKRNMVAQYGPAVLAVPPAHGFSLLVYVLPPLLVGIGIITLVVTLPKWRRRARAAAASQPASAPPLNSVDAQRLDEELGRFA